jgi:hypothetical protein
MGSAFFLVKIKYILTAAHLFFKKTSSDKGGLAKSAGVAQLVEQLTCNQQVAGSSPIASSTQATNDISPWRDSRAAKGNRL